MLRTLRAALRAVSLRCAPSEPRFGGSAPPTHRTTQKGQPLADLFKVVGSEGLEPPTKRL